MNNSGDKTKKSIPWNQEVWICDSNYSKTRWTFALHFSKNYWRFEKLYQTLERVLHQISKHFEVGRALFVSTHFLVFGHLMKQSSLCLKYITRNLQHALRTHQMSHWKFHPPHANYGVGFSYWNFWNCLQTMNSPLNWRPWGLDLKTGKQWSVHLWKWKCYFQMDCSAQTFGFKETFGQSDWSK